MAARDLQTIIFDLGGVLIDVDPRDMLTRLARKAGCAPEQLEATLLDPELLHPLELGQITPEHYLQRVMAQIPLQLEFQEFVQAWNSILSENVSHAQLVKQLYGRYTIVVVTNTNLLHDQFIRQTCTVFQHSHYWIASHEVGLRKPDPAIFHLALQKANAEPAATVYVDDVQTHVQSARCLGMKAIQMTNGLQLADALRHIGVVC